MEFLNKVIAVILLGTVFVACTKTQHSPVPPGGPGVYVSGTQRKADGIGQAVYWKNGSLVELSKNIESSVTNIVVSGNDVYVAGKTGSAVGYWKNGIFDSLGPDINTYVQIAVYGTDVYLSSYSINGPTHFCGVYKNGIYSEVAPPSSDLSVTSIAVGNQGILLGGSTDETATYWLNNVAHTLTNGPKIASVAGVAFDQTDIYAAGSEASEGSMYKQYVAEYWKNDTVHVLSDTIKDDSYTTGIAVSLGQVYISGTSIIGSRSFGLHLAKYWKNNTEYVLTDSLSDNVATAITVDGSDVYVVVQDIGAYPPYPLAKYFRNGKEVDLTDGTFFASASGIFIQPN
jgi:hypothetical protein